MPVAPKLGGMRIQEAIDVDADIYPYAVTHSKDSAKFLLYHRARFSSRIFHNVGYDSTGLITAK
jgi:hypothetical protein